MTDSSRWKSSSPVLSGPLSSRTSGKSAAIVTYIHANKGELVEIILRSLQISVVGPIGHSQQFEIQSDNSSEVTYVEDGWLLAVFRLSGLLHRFKLKDGFSSLDIRICLESLVNRLRTTTLPLSFQPLYIGVYKGQDNHLLAALTEQIHFNALASGWNNSPWSIKWIFLRTSSSRIWSSAMVRPEFVSHVEEE